MLRAKLTPMRRQVLARLVAHQDAVPLTLTAIAKDLGLSSPTVHEHLRNLVSVGLAVQPCGAWGPYEATEAADEAIAHKPPAALDGRARKILTCPCGRRHYV